MKLQRVEIRTATTSDVAAISRLHVANFKENNDTSRYSPQYLQVDLPEELRNLWQARIEEAVSDRMILVAHRETSLLGFVCIRAACDARWGSLIDNLHVHRASRGSGVGNLLMKRGAAWLNEKHSESKVHLHVLESNKNARRFYERLGAQHVGTVDEPTHGGGVVRNCRYVWESPEQI